MCSRCSGICTKSITVPVCNNFFMERLEGNPTSNDTQSGQSIRRRSFLTATGAGALAMTAGCLGDDDDADVGDTITIGAIYPLPGEFPAGTSMENMSEMLVEEVNDDGGLLGADLELIVRDTELDAATTRDRYRELILEDEVDVTAGTYAASAAVPVFDEIGEFETIHVTGGGAQMDIPEEIGNNYDEKKYWFSTTNGVMLGLSTIEFFNEFWEDLGFETIGLATEDIEGFDPILETFLDDMDPAVDVAFEQRFASDTTDFSPILDQGEAEDIDCLVGFVSQGGSAMMTQWAQEQRPYHFGGGEVFSSNPARWEATDGLVEYVWTYIGGSGPGYEATEVTERLIEEYRDRHGGAAPPHQQGYAQWDALYSWVNAVREAGTLDEDEVIPIMEDEVLEVSTGVLEYHDQDGQWPHDPVYGPDRIQYPVVQWQSTNGGGEKVGLHPERSRTGSYQAPHWL